MKDTEKDKTREIDSAIERALDSFDWEIVSDHMKAVNWTWHTPEVKGAKERPSFSRMRKEAKSLLKQVATEENTLSCWTGGFYARKDEEGVRLEFVIVSSLADFCDDETPTQPQP
jgi:hypothetical protein